MKIHDAAIVARQKTELLIEKQFRVDFFRLLVERKTHPGQMSQKPKENEAMDELKNEILRLIASKRMKTADIIGVLLDVNQEVNNRSVFISPPEVSVEGNSENPRG